MSNDSGDNKTEISRRQLLSVGIVSVTGLSSPEKVTPLNWQDKIMTLNNRTYITVYAI